MNRQGIQTVALRDLIGANRADLQTGPFGTQLHASSYVHDGVPVVAVKNIGDNSLVTTDIPMISAEDALRLSRHRLQVNDILFSRKGAVERRALIRASEQGWIQGSDCIRLRFDDSIDARYVSYFLGSMQARQWLKQHAHGATMPSLNQQILGLLQIPLPPLAEQRAIAHILGALDDKIELNRKMNATLDEIARTLFTSWFVDFDPVRAKAEGRQPEGMDAATAALFPNRFVDSEFGPIPEGWKVRGLDAIATFLNGLALQKFPPQGDGADLPVIKIAQLKKGSVEGADLASSEVPAPYIVDDGDVLFSWSGSLEAVIWGGGRGALNQHLFKVTSELYPKWFYYYWIHQHLQEFQAIAAGKATTMGHIQRRHLTQAKVVCPPPVLSERLDTKLAPVVERISANLKECRTLTELRDTLLPELLSGRVRVPMTEHLAQAMVE
jgi:type I restriction enzyme S subunit